MLKWIIVLGLSNFLFSSPVFANIKCIDLVNGSHPIPGVLLIADSFPIATNWSHWKGELSRRRLYRDLDLYEYHFKEDGEFSSSSAFLSRHQRPQTYLDHSASRLALQRFQSIKKKALNFVIAEYQSRRSHWPISLIAKLKKTANEYEKESTYILVKGNNWGEYPNKPIDSHSPEDTARNGYIDPDLMGTMRLIHEKDGLIPLERYLGITIKNPEGTIKVEPGNFAIEGAANSISIITIGIQMLAQAARYKKEFGKDPFFVTYADSLSEKLYGAMGFKPLPGSRVNSDKYIDAKKVEIKKDGIAWIPMYASVEMMNGILNRKLEIQAKRAHKGNPELARNLYSDFKSVIKDSYKKLSSFDTSSDFFSGRVRNQLRWDSGTSGRLVVEKNGDGVNLYLSLDWEIKHTTLTRHMAREPIEIQVPVSDGLNKILEDGSRVSYSNGVLQLTGPSSRFILKVWIDPQLSQPMKAEYYEPTKDSEIQDYFQIEF